MDFLRFTRPTNEYDLPPTVVEGKDLRVAQAVFPVCFGRKLSGERPSNVQLEIAIQHPKLWAVLPGVPGASRQGTFMRASQGGISRSDSIVARSRVKFLGEGMPRIGWEEPKKGSLMPRRVSVTITIISNHNDGVSPHGSFFQLSFLLSKESFS